MPPPPPPMLLPLMPPMFPPPPCCHPCFLPYLLPYCCPCLLHHLPCCCLSCLPCFLHLHVATHVSSHTSSHIVAHASSTTSHVVASHASHVSSSSSSSVHSPASHIVASPSTLVLLTTAILHHVHLLLAESFLHLQLPSFDSVLPDQDDLVNGVIVVKLNKAEASLLAGVVPLQLLDVHHPAEVLEIRADVLVLHLVADASHEDLLHADLGLRLASVASRGGAFCLQGLVVDLVGPILLALVETRGSGVGDKAEAS